MPRYPKAQRDVYSGEDVGGYVIAPATPGGGSGTVTSVAVTTANGFSGSVSNPTTTPQITLQFNATSGQILVGNASNIATPVTMSGDATITNAGVVSVNKTRLIVRNETGSTIPTTRAVIMTGFNNYPLIGLADNTDENKHNVIGLTVGSIAHQANGYIATGGQCDAETNSWPVGTELYWTTSGNLTTTEPTSGEIKHIGIVTVQQNYPTGKILIYNQFEGSMRGAGAGVGLIDRLGDSAGATKWSLRDYTNTEVFSIDSDGKATGSGAGLTSIPWSAMPFTPQAAYTILTTFGSLANANGFLANNGSGALSWGVPVIALTQVDPSPTPNGTLIVSNGVSLGASTITEAIVNGKMNAVANLTLTAPASATTLTLASGSAFTLTGAYAFTFAIPGAFTYTFPGATGTLAALNGTNTWSAAQTWSVNSTFTQGAIFTAYAGGSTAGQFWYDSTQKAMTTYSDGLKQFTSTTMFVMTADGTNGAATAETSIIGTGVGTKTIPGSFFMAGKSIRVRGLGVFTSAAAPGTVTLKLKLGAVVIATSAAVTPTISKTGAFFEFEFLLTCRSATTIQGGGALYMDAVVAQISVPNTTTATIVNATAYAVDVTSTNSIASGCVWTTKVCTIEVMA